MSTHPKHAANKVCLVPYIWQAEEPEFLIHLPKAKNPDEQNQIIWGLVRGTVRNLQGQDLRSMQALHATAPEHIEEPWHTALAEAEEECGVLADDMWLDSVQNHGLMRYASPNKAPYMLHVFSVKLRHAEITRYKATATDAQDIAFKTLPAICNMQQAQQFKAGYLPILQALAIA